jgi:hypothetical protein
MSTNKNVTRRIRGWWGRWWLRWRRRGEHSRHSAGAAALSCH